MACAAYGRAIHAPCDGRLSGLFLGPGTVAPVGLSRIERGIRPVRDYGAAMIPRAVNFLVSVGVYLTLRLAQFIMGDTV